MKLLVLTQKVDQDDPILGFFHRWIIEFSKHCEKITVVCLEQGKFELPINVKVLSLGKEAGQSRLKYLWNFYRYIWYERKNYDTVFVHMNQEYVILGGIFWKIFGKKIFMWRNHHSGSLLTDLAAYFCMKVFCTSKFSYTAKYKKTEIMPVGVDIEKFKTSDSVKRIPQSILSLGRISPSKHLELLVSSILKINNPKILVNIYGNPFPQDRSYYDELRKKAGSSVVFNEGIPNYDTPKVYAAHEIFVNLSSSGMYDKTIFEAIMCGCLILASNENLYGQIPADCLFKQNDEVEFTQKLQKLLDCSNEDRLVIQKKLQTFAKQHSLQELTEKLMLAMK